MIGFYNYTVILTYMSLISAMFSMTFSIQHRFGPAVVFLALSGFFDMFDGKVARRKKNRTDNEKLFGIQLDSLVDVVAFGAAPVVMCHCLGIKDTVGTVAMGFYLIAGVIRLAYFNVLETNNFFSDEPPKAKVYHGLPITSISIILPIVFLMNFFLTVKMFKFALVLMLYMVGALFVANFELKKPNNKVLAFLVILVALTIFILLKFSRFSLFAIGPGVEHIGRWFV